MGRSRIKKGRRATIENVIQEYPELRKELSTLLDDIVFSKGSDSGKTNWDTEYTKPQSMTESKALKIQGNYYQRLQKKVLAVETVYKSLNDLERMVIATRYWSNPKKKTKYCQIDSGYSERAMEMIVAKVIDQVGVRIGEIEG